MGLTLEKVLIIFLATLYSTISSTTSFEFDYHCSNFRCGNSDIVEYPFKFLNQSKEECGYPGFDLGCDSGEIITVNLPNSGKFNVENIDYHNQEIQLQDPQGCLPGRLFELLSNSSNASPFSPFSGDFYNNYTFLSCRNDSKLIRDSPSKIIGCLSNPTALVIASSSTDFITDMATVCDTIGAVAVPQFRGGEDDIATANFTLSLSWRDSECQACRSRGGF